MELEKCKSKIAVRQMQLIYLCLGTEIRATEAIKDKLGDARIKK